MTAKLSGKNLDDRLKVFNDRDIKMVSEYIGALNKSSFECLKIDCGHVWITSFSKISLGGGCPKCAHRLSSHEVTERLKDFNNRYISMTSSYVNSDEKVYFKCLKVDCGHLWKTSFSHISNGTGCPKCVHTFIDEATIKERIESLNLRYIKLFSPYKGVAKHHDFLCLKPKCQHIWKATFDSVWRGKGCPRCAGKARTNEEKAIHKYRSDIRHRISGLYKTGSISISAHKDSLYMVDILNYCKTQVSKLPTKPNDDQDWDLDHIIPVSKFDHTKMEHIKLCWDYRNLQWLPAKVNGSKWSKLMPEYFNAWHYEVLDKLGLTV